MKIDIDIDDLINRLFCAERTRECTVGRGTYQSKIIYEEQRPHVERVIREWYNDQIAEPGEESPGARIAKLEAKVYVYEQVIAKSNFAPLLPYITEVKRGECVR